MRKAVTKLCLLACLAIIPIIILYPRAETGLNSSPESLTVQSLEGYVRANFPFARSLQEFGVSLRFFGGNHEQNGVFIGENALIKNIGAPRPGVVEKNNEAVLEFAQELRSRDIPFYFTLIPTASGVMRGSLPGNAQALDQRHFIGNVYSNMIGKMTVIDTFLTLNANRDRYIFYRTENNLTSFGGYYVYEALAKRLRASESLAYSSYAISYGDASFYGSLHNLVPYKDVQPDVLSFFQFRRNTREHMVTQKTADGNKTYHTLYPRHLRWIDETDKLFLGGVAAKIDIVSSAPFDRSLLVFGDKTAPVYLTFLANHYRQVTFIDLSQDPLVFLDTNVDDYDQVLMAYSVETYVASNTVPSRIVMFVEQ